MLLKISANLLGNADRPANSKQSFGTELLTGDRLQNSKFPIQILQLHSAYKNRDIQRKGA